MNSSSLWRSLERSCSSNCHPARQVSIKKAMVAAIRSGNQPPWASFVMFAATKISSMTRKNPFAATTMSGL